MEDLVASITAMSTSRMRAIHTTRDPQPLFDDPWGDVLVPATLMVAAIGQGNSASSGDSGDESGQEVASLVDDFLRASPAYTNVIVRARYTEDALLAAIAAGVTQYVILGAGFDSFVLRIPSTAKDLTVIEIDHPATQSLKKQRIAECGLAVGENVHFVSADLAREGLDEVLARSPFDASRPAFFAWLGVTMYLTREANMHTLKMIAQSSLAGSQLVFSYIDQKMFEPEGAAEAALFDELEETVESFGEPFISGFHPASLASVLDEVGLQLEQDLNEHEMVERYDPAGDNGFKPLDRSHVARVRVHGCHTANSMSACIKASAEAKEYFFAEGCFIKELSNSADDPDVSIARARLEPGKTTRWHYLQRTAERYVVLQGEGRVEVGDLAARRVEAGDVVVIPPGVRQRISNTGTQDLVFLAICSPRFSEAVYVDIED